MTDTQPEPNTRVETSPQEDSGARPHTPPHQSVRLRACIRRRIAQEGGGGKLLMGAMVVGDLSPEQSVASLRAIAAGGIDLIELIVPTAQPAYHGPVIRRATARALRAQAGLPDALALARRVRELDDEVPLILSAYADTLVAGGLRQTMQAIADAGFDALMITDLPWAHAAPWRALLAEHALEHIPFVSPTTPPARLDELAQTSPPFAVWTGHTGGPVQDTAAALDDLRSRQEQAPDLVLLGSLQISAGDEARAVASVCHGVLVGSALVWLMEGRSPDLPDRLRDFTRDLRAALTTTPNL